MCDSFNMKPIPSSKPKPIKKYDGKIVDKRITHIFLPRFTIQGHQKSIFPILITKLGQHKTILGILWIKKHGMFLDIINDKFIFIFNHCDHQRFKIHVFTPEKKKKNRLVESVSFSDQTLSNESVTEMFDSKPGPKTKQSVKKKTGNFFPNKNCGVYKLCKKQKRCFFYVDNE